MGGILPLATMIISALSLPHYIGYFIRIRRANYFIRQTVPSRKCKLSLAKEQSKQILGVYNVWNIKGIGGLNTIARCRGTASF